MLCDFSVMLTQEKRSHFCLQQDSREIGEFYLLSCNHTRVIIGEKMATIVTNRHLSDCCFGLDSGTQ